MRLSILDIPIVVVTTLDAASALWRRLLPGSLLGPLPPSACASIWIVELRERTNAFSLDILRLGTIEFTAVLWLFCEYRDVVPRRWMPIRVVISLLRALQTVALVIPGIAIGVLASRGGSAILINLLVRRVKALVPLALKAVLIEIQRLVVSSLDFGCLLLCWVIVITSSRVRSSAIAKRRIVSVAHVLQNDLAVQVRMTNSTSMLIVPFDVELRTLIELHGSEGRAFFGDIIIVVLVLAGRLAVIPNLVA
mmetsp:Transcript_49179/g.114773  ORF Transcript_49179/g.114773 Transcript_49179/m.114773 type:complete len:251 (+) Transcript_49179:3559-4311(+)